MDSDIIESAEWHISRLNELIKIESDLEKFRTPGAKDKNKRKKRSIKDMILESFGNKKDSKTQSIDEKLRNLKRAQKHHLRLIR